MGRSENVLERQHSVLLVGPHSIDTMELLRANTFGYDESYYPCGYRRTNGPDHLCGDRVGDIHDGSEYSREEWSLDLRAL